MTDPAASALVARLIEDVKARRVGATGAPCSGYVVTAPHDHGYRSCERCGWSEPEHVIDNLLEALTKALVPAPQEEQTGLATCSWCDYHEVYALGLETQKAAWERLTAHVRANHAPVAEDAAPQPPQSR